MKTLEIEKNTALRHARCTVTRNNTERLYKKDCGNKIARNAKN
jgi:hypothetical protein